MFTRLQCVFIDEIVRPHGPHAVCRCVRLIRNATKSVCYSLFLPFSRPPWKRRVFNFDSVPAGSTPVFNMNACKMTVHNVALVGPDTVLTCFITGQPRRNGSANDEFRRRGSCQLLDVNAGRRPTGQRYCQHDNTIEERIERVATVAGVHVI